LAVHRVNFTRWRQIARAAASAVALVALFSACDNGHAPAVTYTPEIAGVINSFALSGTNYEYRLTDGRNVELPSHITFVRGSSGIPGQLLLTGQQPAPWMAVISDRGLPSAIGGTGVCFYVAGFVQDEQDHLTFDDGLRFVKAPSYVLEPGVPLGDRIAGSGGCLDDRGEIFWYGI
jgi:hypothetical protein